MGLLWTAGLGISGLLADKWYLLCFVWGSLYFVGYVMNGVLLSREWLWAAGVLLASLIGAFLAGPDFYWLPGVWIGRNTFFTLGRPSLAGATRCVRPFSHEEPRAGIG